MVQITSINRAIPITFRSSILKLAIFAWLVFCQCSCSASNGQSGVSVAEFAIGKWEAEIQVEDLYGIYTKYYLVDFIDEDTLFLEVISPQQGFRAQFDYSFIDEETIRVENERAKGGEWRIVRSGERLLLCIWSTDESMAFHRADE